jgi:hypothetical protein
VDHDQVAYIHLTYADLQKVHLKELPIYYDINPIICRFSAGYKGGVSFWLNPHELNGKPEKFTIAKGRRLTRTFTTPVSRERVRIWNLGCSSGWGGDKCLKAKEHLMDAVYVVCY